MVGNEFLRPRPGLQLNPSLATEPAISIPVVAMIKAAEPVTVTAAGEAPGQHHAAQPVLLEYLHRHTLIILALLLLMVAAGSLKLGAAYYTAHYDKPASFPLLKRHEISGLSLAVPAKQLDAKLAAITGQSAKLTVGDQLVTIDPDTIKSWLQIRSNSAQTQDYVFVNKGLITKSLTDLANKFVKAPVNQVTVTHDGVSQVVVTGRNGAQLTNPSTLTNQANDAAKTLMDGKGLQFSTPLATQAYQVVTPAAFSKLIEVNVDTKEMWLYDNGNLTSSYAVSAGKPSTPTPIGEFHIFAKYASQDMKGTNPDGTPYFQPHVHWINYFLPGGYAVHGVYWHPLSWFGANNSSHGCVGIPDAEAEVVYNWAPIGTTVITHY